MTMSDQIPEAPPDPEVSNEVKSTTVADLSSGILSSCEAELISVSKELKDFTDQQNQLIDKLSSFNRQSETNSVFVQLKNAMDLISTEMDRLTLLRQDMTAVQERSQKLRLRAEKLKGRALEKERRDEDLVAQLVGHDGEVGVVGVDTKVELGM